MSLKNYENSRYLQRLITKTSQHANIRRDVVEVVVRAVIDIIASDIANKGEARIPYVLTVRSFEHKGHTNGIHGTSIEPSLRMSAKISNGIRKLWKRHNDEGIDITPNNWRDYLYEETLKKSLSSKERHEDRDFIQDFESEKAKEEQRLKGFYSYYNEEE